jgi:BMFP domain-containing protein YqiC
LSHVTQEEFKIVGEATLELLNRVKVLENKVAKLEER